MSGHRPDQIAALTVRALDAMSKFVITKTFEAAGKQVLGLGGRFWRDCDKWTLFESYDAAKETVIARWCTDGEPLDQFVKIERAIVGAARIELIE